MVVSVVMAEQKGQLPVRHKPVDDFPVHPPGNGSKDAVRHVNAVIEHDMLKAEIGQCPLQRELSEERRLEITAEDRFSLRLAFEVTSGEVA
jgi:hypothetical protein